MNHRPEHQQVRISFGGPLTPVVRMLLWVNVLSYVALQLAGDKLFLGGRSYREVVFTLLGVSPAAVFSDWALWQPVTYLFLHGSLLHLLFNMLALWWFGSEIELHWGSRRFFRYFLFCGVGAGVVSALFSIPTIGASGAIFALLLAYGLMFPNRVLYLYFIIPVKAKYCVLVFGVLELLALISAGPESRVNHLAHLSGLAFGLLWFIYFWQGVTPLKLWNAYKRRKARRRLRVIRKNQPPSAQDDDSFFKPTIH